MDNRFGLQLQNIGLARNRVLVVADLLRNQSPDGQFTTREIREAFLGLHVPPAANISRELQVLAKAQLTLQRGDKWVLTPLGVDAAGKVGIEAPVSDPLTGTAMAEFAHTDHTVIPHYVAPPRWKPGIARLLERHEFDNNVLCMTRFPSEGGTPDPVAAAIERARSELEKFGLKLHLASDAIVEDDLLGNVGAYMWACRYGLGIIEDRLDRGLNYNAVIELGGMGLTGRRCGILKDRTAPKALPTDLSGQIYKSVDLDDLDGLGDTVRAWAKNDLGRS